MTERERILAVYRGETPDRVPCMLDLSHWFYHRRKKPWDLSVTYVQPECEANLGGVQLRLGNPGMGLEIRSRFTNSGLRAEPKELRASLGPILGLGGLHRRLRYCLFEHGVQRDRLLAQLVDGGRGHDICGCGLA